MNIVQALASGYAVDQILDLLGNQYPSLTSKLKSAQRSGYDVQRYLKSLQGTSKKDLKKMEEMAKSSPNPLISGQQYSREGSAETTLNKKVYPALGAAAATAGGAYLAGKVLPQAGRAIGSLLGNAASPSPQQPIGPQPMGNAPVQPPPIPPVGPAAPQNAAAQAAQAAPAAMQQAQNAGQSVLQQMGLEERLKTLQSAGNAPEAISAGLEVSLSPGQKKWLNEQIKAGQAKPIGEMVKDYLSSQPQQQPIQRQPEQPKLSPTEQPVRPRASHEDVDALAKEWDELESRYEKENKHKVWEDFFGSSKNPPQTTKQKIAAGYAELKKMENRHQDKGKSVTYSGMNKEEIAEAGQSLMDYINDLHEKDNEEISNRPKKGDLVASADGIVGDLKDSREKESLIESNGKLHKVKTEDLIHADADTQEAIKKLTDIPEEERSAAVDLVRYIPEAKTIITMLPNGGMYVYMDVDRETADAVANEQYLAKTTGENPTGIWIKGEPSRGAAYSQLLSKNPKYSKDNHGKTWFRTENLRDAFEKYRKFRKEIYEIKKRSRS